MFEIGPTLHYFGVQSELRNDQARSTPMPRQRIDRRGHPAWGRAVAYRLEAGDPVGLSRSRAGRVRGWSPNRVTM